MLSVNRQFHDFAVQETIFVFTDIDIKQIPETINNDS